MEVSKLTREEVDLMLGDETLEIRFDTITVNGTEHNVTEDRRQFLEGLLAGSDEDTFEGTLDLLAADGPFTTESIKQEKAEEEDEEEDEEEPEKDTEGIAESYADEVKRREENGDFDDEDPCLDGYEQDGTRPHPSEDREIPNCVPVEEEPEEETDGGSGSILEDAETFEATGEVERSDESDTVKLDGTLYREILLAMDMLEPTTGNDIRRLIRDRSHSSVHGNVSKLTSKGYFKTIPHPYNAGSDGIVRVQMGKLGRGSKLLELTEKGREAIENELDGASWFHEYYDQIYDSKRPDLAEFRKPTYYDTTHSDDLPDLSDLERKCILAVAKLDTLPSGQSMDPEEKLGVTNIEIKGLLGRDTGVSTTTSNLRKYKGLLRFTGLKDGSLSVCLTPQGWMKYWDLKSQGYAVTGSKTAITSDWE